MPTHDALRMRVLFSVFLHVAAKQLGFSQRDVADACGFSPQLLSDIKAGRRPMTVKMAKRIAALFDVDWESMEKHLPFEWRLKPAEVDDLLNVELPKINHHLFPPLREPQMPEQTLVATKLPILDRPTQGEPRESESFTGHFSALPEPGVVMAKRATRPYLLRLLNGDHAGQFSSGDLLLVDQDISDLSSRVLAIRRHDDFGLVRWSVEREDEFHPVHINPRPPLKGCIENREVVGVVKAVIWSPLKRSNI